MNTSTLLYINSSARGEGSVSNRLAGEFVRRWQAAHPQGRVVERDLGAEPLPHLDEALLGALFTPAENRSAAQAALVARSDALVDELFAADTLVITAPMYNFAIPSTLKAWIDHIARAGRTFRYTESGPVGLVRDRQVYVFTAAGGLHEGGPMDFVEPYLRGMLGFIGLSDVQFVRTEGLALDAESAEAAIAATRDAIPALLAA